MTPTKKMPVSGELTGKNRNGANGRAIQPHDTTARPKTQDTISDRQSMLAHALRYALAGWRVLPLVANGKAPLTDHGVKDASSDPEQLGAWWQRWPAANIGLALGDDLVCFDVDLRNGGNLDALARLDLNPSDTITQRTASGGWHVIYQKPHGLALAGKVPGVPGVDVLSGDKYIVAAPSTIDGKPYTWERDPLDVDPARIPLDLAERLTKRSPAAPTDAQDGPTAAQPAQPGRYDLQDLQAMLAKLNPWQDGYTWWLSTMMAAHAGFGDDALPYVEAWADGKPGEVAAKFATFDAAGGVSVGTLVYHARLAGWVPTPKDDDGEPLPEHWRITPDDWKACPTCANLYTEPFDDGSVRTFHRWCRRPACPVFKKKLMRDALRVVFSWRGVASEIVPAADWRKRRKTIGLACGEHWQRLPMADGGTLLLYETDNPTEQLDDVLEMAAFVVLDNAEARRAKQAEKRQALNDALAGAICDPQLAPLAALLSEKRPKIAQARAFLDSIDVHAVLDLATLELVRAALDVLASKTPGNVSPPRRKRAQLDAPSLAELDAQPPRPKSLGPVLVSKPYHRRAILDVLNRLNIPWERRSYGGWRTEPLDDVQRIQLITALAFAVHGAIVPAGALNSAMVPHGRSQPEPSTGGQVYLTPHHALLDAHKHGRKVPELERKALE